MKICPKSKYKKIIKNKKLSKSELLYSIKQKYNNIFTPRYILKNIINPHSSSQTSNVGPKNFFIIRHSERDNGNLNQCYSLNSNGTYRSCKIPDFINKLGKNGYPIEFMYCYNPTYCDKGNNNNFADQPFMHGIQTASLASFLLNIPLFTLGTNYETDKLVNFIYENKFNNQKNIFIIWESLGIQSLLKSIISKAIELKLISYSNKEDWIEKNTPVEPINYIDSKWPAWNDGNFNMVYHLDEKYHFNYFLQPIATCFRNNNSILLGKTEFAFQC